MGAFVKREKRTAPDRLQGLRDRWSVAQIAELIALRLEERRVRVSRPDYAEPELQDVPAADLLAIDEVCLDLEAHNREPIGIWAGSRAEVVAFAHRMTLRHAVLEPLAEQQAEAVEKVARALKLLQAGFAVNPGLAPAGLAEMLSQAKERCESARKRRRELLDCQPVASWRATGVELELFATGLQDAIEPHGLSAAGEASDFGRLFALCLEVAGHPRLQLKRLLRDALG